MEYHKREVCPGYTIKCPFADYGCSGEVRLRGVHAYACVRVCWHACLMGQWFAWSIFSHTRLSSPLPPGVKKYGGKKELVPAEKSLCEPCCV